MLSTFKKNLAKLQLNRPELKWLLAVSGGIDSVVMMHLFKSIHYQVGIAHCNFQLRGAASDEDEKFVKEVAQRENFPFYSIRFDTKEVARKKGISIQMAARELRYNWFGNIRNEEGYDLVALAHNKDDVLETFFINLARGTGIKGLTGMPVRRDTWVRPLLFASRLMIQNYQKEQNVAFREDASNASLKYIRNRIRHIIIPELEKINPSFRGHLIRTIDHLNEVEHTFHSEFEKLKKKMILQEKETTYIDIGKLKKKEGQGAFLNEFLRTYHFNGSQIADIVKALDGPSGKIFYAPSYRIVKDRKFLVLTPRKKDKENIFFIDYGLKKMDHPVNLGFKWSVLAKSYKIQGKISVAAIDESLLQFHREQFQYLQSSLIYHRAVLLFYPTEVKT